MKIEAWSRKKYFLHISSSNKTCTYIFNTYSVWGGGGLLLCGSKDWLPTSCTAVSRSSPHFKINVNINKKRQNFVVQYGISMVYFQNFVFNCPSQESVEEKIGASRSASVSSKFFVLIRDDISSKWAFLSSRLFLLLCDHISPPPSSSCYSCAQKTHKATCKESYTRKTFFAYIKGCQQLNVFVILEIFGHWLII